MALAEGELTIMPSSSVEFTDDISGKSDSESNHPLGKAHPLGHSLTLLLFY